MWITKSDRQAAENKLGIGHQLNVICNYVVVFSRPVIHEQLFVMMGPSEDPRKHWTIDIVNVLSYARCFRNHRS